MGERGGINLYGMAGNDAVNWIDILGKYPSVGNCNDCHPPRGEAELRDLENRKCTVLVVFGHGTLGNRSDGLHPYDNPIDDTIHDHNAGGGNTGFGGCLYVGCNANELNDSLPENQQVPSPPLPYIPGPPGNLRTGMWDGGTCEDLEKLLDVKIKDAEKKAEELCDGCCIFWKVKIQILPGMTEAGLGEKHPDRNCPKLYKINEETHVGIFPK